MLFFIDLIALNIVFFLTLWLLQKKGVNYTITPYLPYWLVVNIDWILVSSILGLYSEKLVTKFEQFIKRTSQILLIWVIFILVYLVLVREIQFSRVFIFLVIFNFGLILVLNRFLYFKLKSFVNDKTQLTNKVIILGYNDVAKKIAHYFEEEGVNTQLVGFAEDEINIHELTNYPILSNINKVVEIAKKMGVKEIFSTIMPEQHPKIYQLMNDAEGECVRFKVVPDFSLFLFKPVLIDYINDMPVLALRGDPLEDMGNRIKKRFLDILLSGVVTILILSWLVPIMAILIKIESRGPVFFKQLRSGKNDIPFYCLKFRSMQMNEDADTRSASKNDKRVTRIGAFIRKTSLDEFPQFINVLLGEMSIVGPRPHMVNQSNKFSKIVDHYMTRQFLKPGITGWAQINSYRGEIQDQQQIVGRVAKDLWYYENWNLWLDIKIIFLTVYQVFLGDKHAY